MPSWPRMLSAVSNNCVRCPRVRASHVHIFNSGPGHHASNRTPDRHIWASARRLKSVLVHVDFSDIVSGTCKRNGRTQSYHLRRVPHRPFVSLPTDQGLLASLMPTTTGSNGHAHSDVRPPIHCQFPSFITGSVDQHCVTCPSPSL
jgi:hypothetical protein